MLLVIEIRTQKYSYKQIHIKYTQELNQILIQLNTFIISLKFIYF